MDCDIHATFTFLLEKTGSLPDSPDVLGGRAMGKRELALCGHLGFTMKDDKGRVKITSRGSLVVLNRGEYKTQSSLGSISGFLAYRTIIENAVQGRFTVTVPEVVSFWPERFSFKIS